MTIKVTQDGERTFTIYWDEKDPLESMFNNWTEQDFINAIQDYLNQIKSITDEQLLAESIYEVEEFYKDIETIGRYISQNTISTQEESKNNYIEETNRETFGD